MKKILFDIHKSKVMITGHQYQHLSVDDFICLPRQKKVAAKEVFVEQGLPEPEIILTPVINNTDEGAAYITKRMARGYTGKKKKYLE